MTRYISIILFLINIPSALNAQPLYATGLKSDRDILLEESAKKMPQTVRYRSMLPSKVSLEKYAPIAGNQLSFGTCTGWAVVYGARTILEAERNQWNDPELITRNAFTHAFNFKLVEPNNENCSGSYISDMVKSLEINGALPVKLWNRTGSEYHCPINSFEKNLYDSARQFILQKSNVLYGSQSSSEEKISLTKESIASRHPVVIGMKCPTSFHRLKGSDLWEPEENPAIGQHGNHAMVVIGYDNFKYGGAFHIQNSWGPGYGINGRVWVPYKVFANWVFQGVELYTLPPVKPKEVLYKGSFRIIDVMNEKILPVNLAPDRENWTLNPSALYGNNFTYRIEHPIQSGDRIRLMLKTEKPGFTYILSSGNVKTDASIIFPQQGYSPALTNTSNEIALPGEAVMDYFEADDNKGKDYLIIILSREPLDINSINRKLNEVRGEIGFRLSNVLRDRLVIPETIKLSTREISFEVRATDEKDKIFCLIIESDHS